MLFRSRGFSSSGSIRELEASASASSELGTAVTAALEHLGAPPILAQLYSQAREAPVRLERFHGWFDALRTLRFLHLLRDSVAPSLPYQEALVRAEFIEAVFADGTPAPKTQGGKPRDVRSTLDKMRAGVVSYQSGPSTTRMGQ